MNRKKRFKNLDMVTDWTLLLETLRQWEVWLKSDQMEVERARETSGAKTPLYNVFIPQSGQPIEWNGPEIVQIPCYSAYVRRQ